MPENMFRGQLEGLLSDVSKYIGMSDSLLKSLLTMIRSTRPSDWTNPEIEPVCSRMQVDLADDLDKTDRAVRSDEWALEHSFGFLIKDVSNNGSRRCSGDNYRQGLVFTSLIEKVEDLIALRDQMQREKRETKTLKLKCSALRRQVKMGIIALHPEHPDDEELCDVRDIYVSWPRRYSAFKSLEAIEDHYDEVSQVLERVDKCRERLQMLHDSSARAESNIRRYIQDTTQEPYVICNASVDTRADGKPSDANLTDTPPIGGVNCRENKYEAASDGDKPENLDWLTPMRLYYLASEEFRMWLKVHQKDREVPDERDFILAAIDRTPELGINGSAWKAAVAQMGDMTAALCLLVIDANRTHPVTPVLNPGGLLRAMTRRHAKGQLNLYGSLKGLSERARNADT